MLALFFVIILERQVRRGLLKKQNNDESVSCCASSKTEKAVNINLEIVFFFFETHLEIVNDHEICIIVIQSMLGGGC